MLKSQQQFKARQSLNEETIGLNSAYVYEVDWETPYGGWRRAYIIQLEDGRYGYCEKLLGALPE